VDANGNATYDVPITVPPGLAGMAPSLSLAYRSGSGNGPLGVGWSIGGVSSIKRCAKNLADDGARSQVQFHPDDALCLDGERMVLQSGENLQPGAVYYLRHHRQWEIRVAVMGAGTANGHFRVRTDTGRILIYGQVERNRRYVGGTNYEWPLDREEDRFGNYVEYQYHRETGMQMFGDVEVETVEELLLDRILYTGHHDGDTYTSGTRLVDFEYEYRPAGDVQDGYWAGVHQVLSKRLHKIMTKVGSDVVRTYELEYDNSSITGKSRLLSLTECDTETVCKPPTTFTWGQGESGYTDSTHPGEQPNQHVTSRDMKRSVLLDLNGDGRNEMLFAHDIAYLSDDVNTSKTWKVWSPDTNLIAITDVPAQAASAGPRPTEAYALDAYELSSPYTLYQEDFGIFAANLNNDGYDDVIVPVNRTCVHGECETTDHHLTFADGFQLLLGTDSLDRLDSKFVDAPDRFYTVFAGDFDGDGRQDIAGCTGGGGDGYKSGSWTFGISTIDESGPTLQFVETSHHCSSYDEILVLDRDGDGTSEVLFIRAYTAQPQDPLCLWNNEETENCGSDNIYELWPPIPDEHRSDYQTLHYEPALGFATTDTAHLPRDLFQRWRDETCQNAMGHHPFDDWGTQQQFGAGRGQDKIVDINGDGLADILRFELADGDGANYENDIVAIKEPFNPGEALVDNLCDSESDKTFGIRLYLNTGKRFERGTMIWVDNGNPQEAYWKRFVPAQPIDWNADGRTDLLFPRIDPDTNDVGPWDVLVSQGQSMSVESTPFVWPIDASYRPPSSWIERMLNFEHPSVRVRARASTTADVDGDTLHDLVFVAGDHEDDKWPQEVDVWRHRGTRPDLMTRITDGFGAVSEFAYAPPADGNVIHGNRNMVRGRMLAAAEMEDVGMGGFDAGLRHVTRHQYISPRGDPGGRGFIGFDSHVTRETYETSDLDVVPLAAITKTSYDNSYDETTADYPRAGRPAEVTSARYFDRDGEARQHVTHVTTHYDVHGSGPPGLAIYSVVTNASHRAEYDLGASACLVAPCTASELERKTPLSTASTQLAYAGHDRLRVIETVTGDGFGTKHEFTYESDEEKWLIGMVTSEKVTSTAPGVPAQIRYTTYTNDPDTGARTGALHEPEGRYVWLATQYAYSPRGNLTKVATKDYAGTTRNSTIVWGNDEYFPTAITDPMGHLTQQVFHTALGVATHVIEPSGVTRSHLFDGFGRSAGEQRLGFLFGPSDGADTTIELQAPVIADSAVRVRERVSGGQDLITDLDRLGRPIRRQWKGYDGTLDVGSNVYATYSYNPLGSLATASLPAFVGDDPAGSWQFTRDGLGRVVTRTRPDGKTWSYKYSNATVEERDPEGKRTRSIYDQAGHIKTTFDANGTETCLTYGPFNTLVATRPNCAVTVPTDGPHPTATTYRWDPYGKLLEVNDPISGKREHAWYAFGELAQTKSPLGTTDYTYDANGRPLTRTDSSGIATWTWDVAGNGRLSSTSSPDGVIASYIYDAYGRPSTTTTTIGGAPYSVTIGYDAQDRPTSLTYPTSGAAPLVVMSSYDAWGHLREIRNGFGGPLLWKAMLADPAGQLVHEKFGNNVYTKRMFDPLTGDASAIQTVAGATTIQHEAYQWSPAGDLLRRDDFYNGQYETFTYDDVHRLKSTHAALGFLVPKDTWISYDRLGNITSKSDAGGLYVYDTKLRLSSAAGLTFGYDGAGNITRRGIDQLSYNPAGRLTKVPIPGGALTFEYDSAGKRARRYDDVFDEQTIYVANLYERTIYDSAPGGNNERLKIWGNGRVVAEITRTGAGLFVADVIHYVHEDQLGSGALVTNSLAAVESRASYDAWGARRWEPNWASASPPVDPTVTVGFTGHRMRLDSGLVDMGGRLYMPNIGRFISPDPYVQDPTDARAHNRYSYAWNRPLSLTDPSGYFAEGTGPNFDDYDDETGTGYYDMEELVVSGDYPGGYDDLDDGGADLGPVFEAMADRYDADRAADYDDEPAGGGGNNEPDFDRAAFDADFLDQHNHPDAPPAECLGGTWGDPTPVMEMLDVAAIPVAIAGTFVVELISVDEVDVALLSSGGTAAVADGPLPVGEVYLAGTVAWTGGRRTLKAVDSAIEAAQGIVKAYNRREHYGVSPTRADRKALGAGTGEVVDHSPSLVQRYYEGDPSIGEKPGFQMTAAERRASAADRSRMAVQPRPDSNRQGGFLRAYSQAMKQFFGL
jgi:RHS repeat-associated protein